MALSQAIMGGQPFAVVSARLKFWHQSFLERVSSVEELRIQATNKAKSTNFTKSMEWWQGQRYDPPWSELEWPFHATRVIMCRQEEKLERAHQSLQDTEGFPKHQVLLEDRGSTGSTEWLQTFRCLLNLNSFYFCVGTGQNNQNVILSRTILCRILRRCSRTFGWARRNFRSAQTT